MHQKRSISLVSTQFYHFHFHPLAGLSCYPHLISCPNSIHHSSKTVIRDGPSLIIHLIFSFQSGVFQNGNGRIHGGRHVSTTSYEQVTINLLLVLHYVLLLLLHLLLLHHPHVDAHQALLRRTGAKLPTPSELLIECPSAPPPCPFIRSDHHHPHLHPHRPPSHQET